MHNDSDREVMNTTSSDVRVMEKRTTRPNRRPFIGLITLLLPCFLDTVASESQSSTSRGDQVVISQVHTLAGEETVNGSFRRSSGVGLITVDSATRK